MIKALLAGRRIYEALDAKGRLWACREAFFEAISTADFSEVHRYVAQVIEQRIARFDRFLLDGLRPWEPKLQLLQSVPWHGRVGGGRRCCWWRWVLA